MLLFVGILMYGGILAQYVGIGTTTPSRTLHIADSTNNTNLLIEAPASSLDKDVTVELKQAGGSSDWLRLKKYSFLSSESIGGVSLAGASTLFSGLNAGDLKIGALGSLSAVELLSGGNRRMYIAANGNIGIGNTVNPLAPLHIVAPSFEGLRIQGPTVAATFYDNTNLRGYVQAWTDGLGISSSGGNHLRLYSNQGSNERLTILANGNVGINNNNPQANLHISAASFEAVRLQAPNVAQTFYNGTNYVGYLQGYGTIMSLGSQGTNRVGLFTSSTERLTVLPSGNVGINTTAPTATFEVNGFSRLGTQAEGAPKIKTKLITGTMAAKGSYVTVNMGIAAEKVLSVSIMSQTELPPSGLQYFLPLATNAYSITFNGTVSELIIYTDVTSTAGLPYKAFIVYTE